MEDNHIKSLLFYGAGEVAELAYLYLQLTKIRLAGIVDEQKNGKNFFGFKISGPDAVHRIDWDLILLTRLEHTDKDIETLIQNGIPIERIAAL